MKHQAGREWWQKNGDSIDVKFDLEHGSPHLANLNAHLRNTLPPNKIRRGGS